MSGLSDAKTGDEVAQFRRVQFATEARRTTITRTTATRITVGCTSYSRKTGEALGRDYYSSDRIEPWNDAEHIPHIERAEARRLRDWIARTNHQAVSLATLRVVVGMLKEGRRDA